LVLLNAGSKNGRSYKISALPAPKTSAEEGMHQRNSLRYKVKSALPEEK